ncbi:NUDIX domain-containing protein [Lacticaseibacillus daqingensis]|uniref:NUDIX domain-containing protein n=1 Tax=Lacticaseibacillus daqingensis TaxID=2486014 RepID=UPI000F7B78A1|nr:NUDIX hydrolase [Lacticaseibacillus daqingensis]
MERKLDATTLYEGRVLTLTRVRVELPDGRRQVREIVHTNGAAGVLAHRGERVLFVRQWRTPLNQETLELPAGRIEPGETALACAKRELNEEGQLAANHWQPLTAFYQSAGFSDAHLTLFEAHQLHRPDVQRPLDDGEVLDGTWLTLAEAQQAQATGLICDAKTVIGLALWQLQCMEGTNG